MTLVALLYTVVACWLAIYGLNALVLTALFFRYRNARETHREDPERLPAGEFPFVTVQLPIYNEKHVATRLIETVCRLDYPRDRLEIQVLDDSTDETVWLVARAVAEWKRRGVAIHHIRRPARTEYKAGALRYGLQLARGDVIAVFDADFVPKRSWLRQGVAHLMGDDASRIGLVQTRWGHLNAAYSPLTRAQALALDGHFVVEQAARCRAGLLFNFNGTAGLWRRECIEEAGGWSGDTLSEDLDLSYRAQLAGWRLTYDPSIEAPAEIPAQLAAYKRQQFRWAKGSIQVARRLIGRVLRSDLTLPQKLGALLHLSAYSVHPMMVVLLLLTLPLLWWGWPAGFTSHKSLLVWASVAGLGAPLLYLVAQASLYGVVEGARRYAWMPLLVLLGSGVALNNSRAVFEGLFGRERGEFQRTPKFRLEGREGIWQGREYHLGVEWMTFGELALAGYALLSCAAAIANGHWFAIPFMLLYALAFGWVGFLTLWQGRAAPRRTLPDRSFHWTRQ